MKRNIYFLLVLLASIYNVQVRSENSLKRKLKVGYRSTCGLQCGVGVYTEHLCSALQSAGYGAYKYLYKLSTDELIYNLKKDHIDILNIQYEPTIMPPKNELIKLIHAIRQLGIKVVFTIHYEAEEIKDLVDIVDQFIYHKEPLFIPHHKKVNIIHHGVPVFTAPTNKRELRKKYGFTSQDIILTTTGFLAGWKEYSSVLELLVSWLQSDYRNKVQLLTSYNSYAPDYCAIEHKKITEVIEKYQLHKQVIHITKFLEQKELSERLWLSDLGYLWAGTDTRSSSGAAAQFMAARLPVVATNSSHYNDLIAGTIKTPQDKVVFIQTVKNTLRNGQLQNELRNELEQYYEKLNYNVVIQQHIRVFKNNIN